MAGAFPSTVGITDETVTPENVVLVSTAQSLKQQVRERPGHRWKIQIKTIALEYDVWRDLEGFLASQRGAYDTFTYIPQSLKTPRGAGGGTPLVNGGTQTGRSLITDGWPNSTAILKRGDVLTIAGSTKVYMVTADVSSNGSGQATLAIEPGLITSPADNAAITITNVPFTVALSNFMAIPRDVNRRSQLELEFIERF